ncbi:MAG: hypothetical protein RLZZ135_2110 [Cyanobacteriota bacterium]|jgi:hypothetical protein
MPEPQGYFIYLGSVGVGLCKYLAIFTSNLTTKPTLITSMKQLMPKPRFSYFTASNIREK